MSTAFAGLWPALVTPLTEMGEPAHDQIEKLVELFVQQGLDGLYVLGSTGQWPLLSLAQRRQVAERVLRSAAGRIPVNIHVGAVATADAVCLGQHAAEIGAAAVSSVAPIYFPATADVVFEHYRTIGAATNLPFFLYHLSGVNQLSLEPQEYAERLLAVPHIAGMKITDRDLYTFGLIHTYTGGKLPLFSGADEVMCHAALSGAVGAIGSFYNLWGPTCQAVRRQFIAGDFVLGREFMLVFQSVIAHVIGRQSMWSFLRSAMRIKYKIEIGLPKAPLGAADKPWRDREVEELIAQVDNLAPRAHPSN